MLVAFDNMKRPVAINGCEEMAEAIRSILHGWTFHRISATKALSPAITLSKTAEGYRRDSEWLDKPITYPNVINAACDFLVDAFKCYIAGDASLLCLHTAAVDFGDGLVLFPSTYNAGKSTLSVQLAALGMKIFADDVLYITGDNMGMAPGVLPRLRLPLPDDGGETFDAFVAENKGPASSRFQYLKLNEKSLASYQEKAPVRKIIELHREPGCEIELAPATTGDILTRTILQNFSVDVPALETLDRLHALAEGAECFSLRYPDGTSAARFLVERFS